MARSIYCSSCKKEKEPGRDNESCCKTCKSERNKAKRVKAREDKGLPPYGSGKSVYCYRCKALKENPNSGWCLSCARDYDNDWRLKTGRTKKHNTGLCPCGAERAPYNPVYCVACAWKQKKAWIEKNGFTEEQIKKKNEGQNRRYRERVGELEFSDNPINIERRKRYKEWSELDNDRIHKIRVRSLTRSYIKTGKLVKKPCEICGYDKYVEAHHDDYNKPMDIRWLCRNHHREHHINEQNKD